MGQRKGVTYSEQEAMKKLVSDGHDWKDIVGLIEGDVSRTKKSPVGAAFLDGADLTHVKTNIYDPLVKMLAEAKKAGHETIHAHEAHLKAEKAKKTKGENLREERDTLQEQLDVAKDKIKALEKDKVPSIDDLTGKKPPKQ